MFNPLFSLNVLTFPKGRGSVVFLGLKQTERLLNVSIDFPHNYGIPLATEQPFVMKWAGKWTPDGW